MDNEKLSFNYLSPRESLIETVFICGEFIYWFFVCGVEKSFPYVSCVAMNVGHQENQQMRLKSFILLHDLGN